jgi:hypothetical protein
MEWFWNTYGVYIACYAAGIGTAWLFGLKGKISDIVLSRTGLRIHTNSGMVVYELTIKNEPIDSSTQKNMRRATEGLTILPPEKYGTSTEVMLINMKANQPLLYASYENHHTRELRANGSDHYFEDKVSDVLAAVRYWMRKYPELLVLTESHVCLWTKKVLIPNLRKACDAKLEYYRTLYKRKDIIESLRDEAKEWIAKNEKYIVCIEALADRPDIRDLSCITNPPQLPCE